MSLIRTAGVVPSLRREVTLRDKALSGDMVIAVTPAAPGSSAAAVVAAVGGAGAKFLRTVHVELQTAAGEVHTWFNGTFGVTIAEVTAGNGVAAIDNGDNHIHLVDGVGDVVVKYTGTWAEADTSTFTLVGSTRLGYTIANKTSVDTLIA
jgi:hypothetical protein